MNAHQPLPPGGSAEKKHKSHALNAEATRPAIPHPIPIHQRHWLMPEVAKFLGKDHT
jgi:hypothetical protein